jgi:hypothetical protein
MATTTAITRDDLEKKLREISGGFDEAVESAKPKLVTVAATTLLVVGVAAYLLGRRRGRKPVVVELRRV